MPDNPKVTMDQLRVGMYVVLNLGWLQHPFAADRFKISSEDQIAAIRSLGLKTVHYNPALSDAVSLPELVQAEAPPDLAVQGSLDVLPVSAGSEGRLTSIRTQREATIRIEKAFVGSAEAIRDIEKNLFSKPAESVRQATQLVNQIAESILCAPELAIHVMGDKAGGDELYVHALNVTMLSLMMAREMGLPQEMVGTLGIGALFHDIGRKNLPSSVLKKTEALTVAERHLYEMHCQYGVEIGQRLKFSPAVLSIIKEHHECFDGTGYPDKLQGPSIGLLSRIVAIANHYDGLCNPVNIGDALTPHEALSEMFARRRSKFDPTLLKIVIRCMGVYPPGTIVQLSSGVIGMVTSVNTVQPMKPMVLTYDESIPRHDAILVDLARETHLTIAKPVRSAQVPGEIYSYFSPRKRVSYYFDVGQPGQETVPA